MSDLNEKMLMVEKVLESMIWSSELLFHILKSLKDEYGHYKKEKNLFIHPPIALW